MKTILKPTAWFRLVLLSSLFSLTTYSWAENGAKANSPIAAPEISTADMQVDFRDTPLLDSAYISASPGERNDGIAVGKLGSSANEILELANEIANGQHDRFDSLLIAHKNKLLFEAYFLRGRVNLPHPQASTTKAYTSFAIGRAIQLGYLTMEDLHKPLVNFLPELDAERFVNGAQYITLHKAMTMRSGLRLDRDRINKLKQTPEKLLGQNQVQAFLEHSSPIKPESQTYHYQAADPTLVMQVLDTVVPGGAESFVKQELLDKLGIVEYRWRTDVSGLPTGANGSRMTSRDMLKWGLLVQNNGEWQGEQLISQEFLTQATKALVQPSDEYVLQSHHVNSTQYGYYWWLNELHIGDKSYLSKSAQGGGGQYIIVIEELELLVVVTAHNRDFHHETLSHSANRILPAFIKH